MWGVSTRFHLQIGMIPRGEQSFGTPHGRTQPVGAENSVRACSPGLDAVHTPSVTVWAPETRSPRTSPSSRARFRPSAARPAISGSFAQRFAGHRFHKKPWHDAHVLLRSVRLIGRRALDVLSDRENAGERPAPEVFEKARNSARRELLFGGSVQIPDDSSTPILL